MSIKKRVLQAGAALALSGFVGLANEADVEASSWQPNTVSEIEAEIQNQVNNQSGNNAIEYTFQWGDTLWAISQATDISVDKLAQVNEIENHNMLTVGNSIYLSQNNNVVSVDNGEEVESYDVSNENVEKTETPQEVKEEAEQNRAGTEEAESTNQQSEVEQQEAAEQAEAERQVAAEEEAAEQTEAERQAAAEEEAAEQTEAERQAAAEEEATEQAEAERQAVAEEEATEQAEAERQAVAEEEASEQAEAERQAAAEEEAAEQAEAERQAAAEEEAAEQAELEERREESRKQREQERIKEAELEERREQRRAEVEAERQRQAEAEEAEHQAAAEEEAAEQAEAERQAAEEREEEKTAVKGARTTSSTGLTHPAPGGSFSSGFGHRWGRMHNGTDFAGSGSIVAAQGGQVSTAGYVSGLGYTVKIDHGNGFSTVYGHMQPGLSVAPGQTVQQGQQLGVMGTTGNSTGVHLHFEVHQNGTPVNPMQFL